MALRLDEKRVEQLKQAWEACRTLVSKSLTDLEAAMPGNEDALSELRSFNFQMNNFLKNWADGVRGEDAEAEFKNIKKIPDFILKGTGENERALYKALIAIDQELDEKYKGKERLQSGSSKRRKEARESKPKKPEYKSSEKTTTPAKTDEEVVQHLVRLFSNYSAAIVKDDDKDDKLHAIDTLWRLVTSYNVTSYNISVIPEKVSAVINFIKNEFKMPTILANDDRPAAVELREALLKIQPRLVSIKTETKQEYLTRTATEKHREADFAVLDKVSKSSKDPLNLSKHPMLARDNFVKIQSHDITIHRLVEYMLANLDEAHKFIKKNKGVDAWGAMNIRGELCKPENEGLLVLLIALGGKEMCKVIDEAQLLDSLRLSTDAYIRLKDLLEHVSSKEVSKYSKETLTTILNSGKSGFDLTFEVIRSLQYSGDLAGYTDQFIKSDIDSKGLRKYLIDNPVKAFEIIKGFGIGGDTEAVNKTKPVSENIAKLLADENVRGEIVRKIKLMPQSEQDKVIRNLIELSVGILAGKAHDIDTNDQYLPIINPIIDLIQAVQPSREQIVAGVIQDLISYRRYDKPAEFDTIKQGRINTFKDIIALAKKAILDVDSKESKNLQEAYFSQTGVMWQRIFEGRFPREEILRDIYKAASDFAAGELLKLGVTTEAMDKITDDILEEIESASKEEKSEREKPKPYEEMSAEEFDEMLGLIRTEQSKSAASSSKSEAESKDKSKEEKSESDDAASEAESEAETATVKSTAKVAPLPDAELRMLDELCNKNKDKPLSLTQKNIEMIAHISNEKIVEYIKLRPDQAWKIFHGITGTSIIPDLNLRKRLCENPHLIRDLIVNGGPIVRQAIVDQELLSSHYLHRYQQHNVLQPILTLIEKSKVDTLFCQEQPMQAIRLSADLQDGSKAHTNLLAELDKDNVIADMIETLQKQVGKPSKPTQTTSQIDLEEFMQKALRDDHKLDKLLLATLESHEQLLATPDLKKFRDAAVIHLFVGAMTLPKKQQANQLQKLVNLQKSIYIPPDDWLNYMHHVSTPQDVANVVRLITALRSDQSKVILASLIDAMIAKEYPELNQIALFNALAKLNRPEANDFIAYCARFKVIRDLINDSDKIDARVKQIAVQAARSVAKAQGIKFEAKTVSVEKPVIEKPKLQKSEKPQRSVKRSLKADEEDISHIPNDPGLGMVAPKVVEKESSSEEESVKAKKSAKAPQAQKTKAAEKEPAKSGLTPEQQTAKSTIDELTRLLTDHTVSLRSRGAVSTDTASELKRIAQIITDYAEKSAEGKANPEIALANIIKALKEHPPKLQTRGYQPSSLAIFINQLMRTQEPTLTMSKTSKQPTRVKFVNPFKMFSKSKNKDKPAEEKSDEPKLKK